ncbi:MAG: hypothetical protein ABL879_00905 [Devosia sp.]
MLALRIVYQRHRRKLAQAGPFVAAVLVTGAILMPAPPVVGPDITVRIAFALVPQPFAEVKVDLVSRPLERPI